VIDTALKFTHGTFKIVQFTDLHYRNGEDEDVRTHGVMREILDAEHPDLVVLSGDVIDGKYCRNPLRSWADAVQPIIDRTLPWAAVFGNHDDEGSATRAELMTAMRQLPGCLSKPGAENLSGVGNFVLPILHHDAPVARLIFLDSHSYTDREPKAYDWIKPDQIDWYRQLPHDLPALMFFHIPLPEFDDVWNAGNCIGSKYEAVCSPKFNSGLFDAIQEAGDVMGVFAGHDHVNDYEGKLAGIRLCYGRATGFASYGRAGFPRGGRVIDLIARAKDFETRVCESRLYAEV